jgi:hypothetical protein
MATGSSLEPTQPGVIDHGTSKSGRWLRARRVRLVLWVAVVEGVVVWLAPGLGKWTIVAIAIPCLAIYIFWGRETQSDTGRQLSWIAAASQALAVVVVILAFLLDWLALLLAVIFAAVALLFLLSDRR